MRDYKKLGIWEKSFALCMEIYDITSHFPDFEKFGLTSQMQRAVVSIPSNIAEGCGRQSDRDFYYFLGIAKGSVNELQTQLYIAAGRHYLSQEEADKIDKDIDEVGSMLFHFMKKLSLS